VKPFRPTITTEATLTVDGLTGIITDSINLTDSGLVAFEGAPTENSVRWVLHGQLAAVDGSCDGLDWSDALVHDAGAIEVHGDGTYSTPAISVTDEGCYTFTEQLAANSIAESAVTTPGEAAETVMFVPDRPVPPDPDPTPTPDPAPDGGGDLPYTGSQPLGLLGAGLLAVLAGGMLLVLSRRRESDAQR
jgi:LPXTG-motif cell wall-anchored protein